MPPTKSTKHLKSEIKNLKSQGWQGWDEYARFYDWENARTLGRVDVDFWSGLAARARGRVLELGCGTGRVTLPVARAGVTVVGVDRSVEMLRRARSRIVRSKRRPRVTLVRGDIRMLPFADGHFALAMAPYGILQSLLRERDLSATLSAVHRVLAPGALFGIDLVPDVPRWEEYSNRVRLKGQRVAGGASITLVESVRHDRAKRLTMFDQSFVERRGRAKTVRQFSLVFRSLPVPQMAKRLNRAGFDVEAVLGDYQGGPWDVRADVWLILARKH